MAKRLEPKKESIEPHLVMAQSLSSIAPLGSVSAYLTFALGLSLASTSLASPLGVLIYLTWVLIGYRYSKKIASTGGIYEFSRSAAGDLIGKISGWLYWVSYMIYLPSVTTYLAYAAFPAEFQASSMVISIIEIAVAVIMILLLLSGIKPPLYYALATSLIEVVLIMILGIKVLEVTGIHPISLTVPQSLFWQGALGVAFTLAGGGATFFLGYEAKGRGETVGKSYLIAFFIASIAVSFAAYFEVAAAGFSNAGVQSLLNITAFPGFYLAEKYVNHTFALLIWIFTLNSLFGSGLAAYIALSRLTYTFYNGNMLKSILTIAVIFLVFNVFGGIANLYNSSILPLLYQYTTEASLVTIFASHAIVSAVYPLFTRRELKQTALDYFLSIFSTVLMGYGLYSNIIPFSYPLSLVAIVSIILSVIIGVIHHFLK